MNMYGKKWQHLQPAFESALHTNSAYKTINVALAHKFHLHTDTPPLNPGPYNCISVIGAPAWSYTLNRHGCLLINLYTSIVGYFSLQNNRTLLNSNNLILLVTQNLIGSFDLRTDDTNFSPKS
jgi:hypothetical protein